MILVTGGSGLVGRELIIQLLEKGKSVRAIYNKTPINITHPGLSIVHGDILDVIGLEELMQDVDEVYHCAGFISHDPKHRSKLYKINVEGTSNIVNACLDAGVRKMVHVSSIAALGSPADPKNLTNENMDWEATTNKNNYGKSKYMGELEVWRAIAEGLDAVIINPSLVLGPGDWNEGSTTIFKSVYDEIPWYTEGTSGFVDVRDVAKSMIALMESGITAQRFIVSAENENFKKVFDMIARAFNKKIPSRKVTRFLAAVVWRFEAFKTMFTGKKPLVTKETAASALAMRQFDNAKLKEYLPSFNYYPLSQTIIHTCTALQQKLNNQ